MLSREERDALASLLAAVKNPPVPMPLAEKLGAWDIVRKWSYFIVTGIVAITMVVLQVRQNSAVVRDLRPKVKTMWWMKDNGYTNKDVAPYGPIKPPDFD